MSEIKKIAGQKKPCPVTVKKENKADKLEIKSEVCAEGFYKDVVGVQDLELAADVVSVGVIANAAISGISHAHNITNQLLHNEQPKDIVEARLILQCHTLFKNGMSLISRAGDQSNLQWNQTYLNQGTKLLRLHNETIEVLNRYRKGNEQRITVQHQHVTVNEGGQAIVGTVNGRGGVEGKNNGGSL